MKLRAADITLSLLYLLLLAGLGYFVEQSDFSSLIGFFTPLFLIYLYICFQSHTQSSIRLFLFTAILARFLLLFTFPGLSDDVYRFIWDGRMWLQGVNPFDLLPSEWIQEYGSTPALSRELFEQLNSPDYFTIYPPVNQGVFALAAWWFPDSFFWSMWLMKLFLFGCEIGSLFFLWKLLPLFGLDRNGILLYALNPLIIIEICGNLHFEGAMIFFLLLALFLLKKERLSLSAVAFALSVASKLLPLMFLPFLLRRLGWRKSVFYYSITGLTLALLFLPLFSQQFLYGFGDSLDLYFRKFEFNASVYYLLRWLGYQFVGYNLIAWTGPLLAASVLAGISILVIREKQPELQNLPGAFFWAICLYLFAATTVHPWYAALPVLLSLFTPFRFPILWSGLIMLTYINYSYSPYQENLWIVALEYTLVCLMGIWEYRQYSQKGIVYSKIE
jgi:alpha-1,6-mannosyltransferase